MRTILTSTEKALKINLQPSIYGVFAEIGAGQEVSNHFYKAGAASGTIAKSICAYDMMMSDSIYGKTARYVSKERLENMLNVEYQNLIASVPLKASMAHFFAFGNTIETTGYQKTNKGQGWLGLKYQTTPNSRPYKCCIHVVMHTDNIHEQQQLIGDLGVNLLYGLYEFQDDPELFILNLKDNIDTSILEINFIEIEGSEFTINDSKALSLLLVKHDLTKMVMFGSNGEVLQPLNAFYKKDAIIIRGRFNPPTKVTVEMFEKSTKQLIRSQKKRKQDIFSIAEITFNCYQDKKELRLEDFLNRADLLSKLGYPVLITNFKFHHELIDFFNHYVQVKSLNLVLGLDNLERSIRPVNNQKNEQKLLELIQVITAGNNQILAFPELNNKGGLNGIKSLVLDKGETELVSFLKNTNRLVDITEIDSALLTIRSNDILNKIATNAKDWDEMVPKDIVQLLQNHVEKLKNTGLHDWARFSKQE